MSPACSSMPTSNRAAPRSTIISVKSGPREIILVSVVASTGVTDGVGVQADKIIRVIIAVKIFKVETSFPFSVELLGWCLGRFSDLGQFHFC